METLIMNQPENATMKATTKKTATTTKMRDAEIVREYRPFGDGKRLRGVTFDGKLVWFARDHELVAFDPESEKVVKQLDVPADAGTAFDGTYLYQLAEKEILVIKPSDGSIVRRMPAPGKGLDSGMAWADGYLWVGQYRDAKIHQVDAKTGAIVKTLSSDRYVTGVSCFDGSLWHGTSDDGPCEIRRLGLDGAVEEVLTVKGAKHLAGLEGTPDGSFWCAGEEGTLRLVRARAET